MAEYIEREAAIKAIDNEVSLDGLYANIKAIPAADVQEVKHGRWEKRKTHNGAFEFWFCSECDRSGGYSINPGFNYCPNCGAKMDGKDIIK